MIDLYNMYRCETCKTEFESTNDKGECPHCGEPEHLTYILSETDKKIEKSEYQRMQDEYGHELYPD